MPRISLKLPAFGESQIADTIRQRRAPRDLTALDGVLLNNPEIANGWNSLLGAVRSKNSLPGDVRELLILRVAARNQATYEWIHHEQVGRDMGLTTPQLSVIRDLYLPLASPDSPAPLTALQAAALRYGDAMTDNVVVPDDVFDGLKKELSGKGEVDQMLMEATATVATYNMVSRLLVALDVGEKNAEPVPFPGMETTEVDVEVAERVTLRARTSKATEQERPWIALVNSLLTDLHIWDAAAASFARGYNVLQYDQRGHGKSSVPAEPCSMDQLADDVAVLCSSLKIAKLHALIGVSQGGATTLNALIRHPSLIGRVVACDTQVKSPVANIAAWDERIALAKDKGMGALAEATVRRWFPAGSDYVPGGRHERVIFSMVASTPLEGFVAGARALQGYDLTGGLSQSFEGKRGLLVAGERDGMLPEGLKALANSLTGEGKNVRFVPIGGAGHLPMVDQTSAFVKAVLSFLEE